MPVSVFVEEHLRIGAQACIRAPELFVEPGVESQQRRSRTGMVAQAGFAQVNFPVKQPLGAGKHVFFISPVFVRRQYVQRSVPQVVPQLSEQQNFVERDPQFAARREDPLPLIHV